MKKKVSLVLVLIIMALSMCFTLVACDEEEDGFDTIYKQESSIPEYTDSTLVCKVPKGWRIDTETDKHSDTGYIQELDAFIIKSGQLRNILFAGDNKTFFNEDSAITQIRIVGDLAAIKNGNDFYVYDLTRCKIVISRDKFIKEEIIKNNPNVDDVVKILDNNLVAINANYDISNKEASHKTYTSIYRPTYTGKDSDRGIRVARIKNIKGDLINLKGFDGRYVVLSNDNRIEGDNTEVTRLFNVISHGKDFQNEGDKIIVHKVDTKRRDVTYIGSGRFYVFLSWTTSGEDYDMMLANDKYKLERYIFNAELGKSYPITGNVVIEKLTNKYYGPEKIGLVQTRDFLIGNKMYAPIGYTIGSDKKASYDQFILDSEMNVILSLSGNLGRVVSTPINGEISMYELILDYVDGYGYAPLKSDVLNLYDKNGKFLRTYSDNESTKGMPVQTASLNNNIMIVEKKINNKLVSQLVDPLTMTPITSFEFNFVVPFTGEQTIAKTQDGRLIVIGKNGKEVKDINGNKMIQDIVSSSTNSQMYGCKEMFTVGCYIASHTDTNGVRTFAVKNFRTDPKDNMIIPFTSCKSCTLYPFDARTVFVMFEQNNTNADYEYEVYKLK